MLPNGNGDHPVWEAAIRILDRVSRLALLVVVGLGTALRLVAFVDRLARQLVKTEKCDQCHRDRLPLDRSDQSATQKPPTPPTRLPADSSESSRTPDSKDAGNQPRT